MDYSLIVNIYVLKEKIKNIKTAWYIDIYSEEKKCLTNVNMSMDEYMYILQTDKEKLSQLILIYWYLDWMIYKKIKR